MSPPQFYLFDGGPLSELQKALRLTRAGQPDAGRSIVAAVLITWFPLVVLSAGRGLATGSGLRESMLLDVAIYARFLIALPLLLLAPAVQRERLRLVVQHFLDAQLVKESERERFFHNLASTTRLRDSRVAELILFALACTIAISFVVVVATTMPASWRSVGPEGNRHLSAAGWWFALVSQPIYMFLMVRLVYRAALWWRFLWRTSRLDLDLNAAHPDGAGGLGFLGLTIGAFTLPVFAISASIAGGLADAVLWGGASVLSQKYVILAYAVLIVAIFVGPLLSFAGELAETKRRGVLAYGELSGQQLRALEQRWLGGNSPQGADVLNASDFSAVTDLSAVTQAVHEMRVVPFQRNEIVPLVLAALLPFVPVIALEIPLKDIAIQLVKMIA